MWSERSISHCAVKCGSPPEATSFSTDTEAMYTIDVNSGRSSHQTEMGRLEESLVQINMEAAEEIARQLRLRNIGGLVICDFIDMRMRKSQRTGSRPSQRGDEGRLR